jgi:bifunctional non-homologous end joining protein LigD
MKPGRRAGSGFGPGSGSGWGSEGVGARSGSGASPGSGSGTSGPAGPGGSGSSGVGVVGPVGVSGTSGPGVGTAGVVGASGTIGWSGVVGVVGTSSTGMGRGYPPSRPPTRGVGYGPGVPPKRVEVDIEGRTLSLSNLDKVLYPEAGFTKGQVIDYYSRVAPAVLPHLRSRPLTLKRYPNGVDKGHFYEKQCPSHRPDWVQTTAVHSRHRGGIIDFCLAEDLPTLVWLSNLADLELHTSLARAEDVTQPTILAFDLDPGPPATIVHCARVALALREALDHLGMQAWPKTSGSKGMQVYVPINVPVTYEDTKPFALGIAKVLERRLPDLVISEMRRDLRKGKVFVDWSQNDEHKTTVSVYSLRALPQPTVSTPLTWEEVEAVTRSEDPGELVFGPQDVLARVTEHGDLFAPVQEGEQPLPTRLRAA